MFLEHLELVDFRSYRHAALELDPGVSVIIGPNAQGKTNLLEAIHYLAVGESHRVSSEAPLVRRDADAAVVRAAARVEGGRRLTVECELRPAGRNRSRVNGQPQPRYRDAVGHVRAVLFAPEDLTIVRGDPSERRRFLDTLLAQRRPAYAAARADFDRILRQRNALLRQVRGRRASAVEEDVLATWTASLIGAGASLAAARIAVVHALAAPADHAYRDLVAGGPSATKPVALAYQLSTGRTVAATPGEGVPDPAALAEELAGALAGVADEERQRGMTLVGPHRDDLLLSIGDLPAKGYASHGEQWSLVLALRLASRDVLGDVGEEPVVLLDDVFAELDDDRRQRLAGRCAGFEQVLVTAAVAADVPLAGRGYDVRLGAVAPVGRAAT